MHPGQGRPQRVPDPPLVVGVEETEDQAHRHRLDTGLPAAAYGGVHRFLVQRRDARRRARPFSYDEPQVPGDQRGRAIASQVVQAGRFWRPISSTSRKPSVVTRAVRAPRRSSSALVATVEPCAKTPTLSRPGRRR